MNTSISDPVEARTASLIPCGAWSDPASADFLWRSCLESKPAGDRPVDRFIAALRFYGIIHPAKQAVRVANIAWTNGAMLARADLGVLYTPERDTYLLISRKIVDGVLQAGKGGGSGLPAVAEQRRLLEAALTPEILEEIRNLARLVIIVMAAGSLAFDELHLPTWRVASLEAHNSLDSFLINLMLRDQLGLSEPEKQETLARFVAGLYDPTAKLEVLETTTAICASLEEARRNGWSVCQFTRDAIRQGSDLFKQHIDRAEAMLEEMGSPAVQCVESVFGEARLMPLHQRKDHDAWSAMVRWMQQTHNDAAGSKEMDGALLVLAYAYMFLFWFGILREKSRAEHCDTTRSISINN